MSDEVFPSSAVLHVTRFTGAAWQRIDSTMRETMRTFVTQAGLTGAWFGRRTTEAGEERALVSVWATPQEESKGLRLAAFLDLPDDPPDLEATVLPVAFDMRAPRRAAPAVLRLYDGLTRPGQLDAYVEEAMAASRQDSMRPDGPLAVCTALDRPDRFLTASIWSDWASLEACTGGDIRRPLVSRNVARLAGGGPSHYEIIASG